MAILMNDVLNLKELDNTKIRFNQSNGETDTIKFLKKIKK